MKKLFTGITAIILSMTIISTIPTNTLAANTLTITTPQFYSKVCRVSTSELDENKNYYDSTLIDEDGEAYLIYTNDNLTNKWLNVDFYNNETPTDQKDDIVYNFEILPDNN